MADANPDNKEYAAELRARFVKKGAQELSDIELLCLLLSFSNVKDNLTDVSNALVERFQTPGNCYTASYNELISVEGMTHYSAIIVFLIGRLAALRDEGDLKAKSAEEYEAYFLTLLYGSGNEDLWAAALDTEGAICAIECLSRGGMGGVETSAGAIVRFAVKNGTKSLIIAHAHPDAAEPEESQTDIYSRKYLAGALNSAGVTLKGQIIVAGGKAKMYHTDENE